MPKNISLFFVSFAFCLLFILPFRAYGAEAKITDLLVTSTAENVLVYFRVADCFTKDMEDAIFTGLPITFTFLLEVYQERKYWLDKRESRLEIKHIIKYDNIKKIFYVSFTEKRGKRAAFTNLNDAKRSMSDLNDVPVVPRNLLKGDKQYYIRAKAKLGRVHLPLQMERILFFVSLWDFETDWHRHGIVY
jgi:hypothetical protein